MRGDLFGDRRGRELRSIRPSAPSARNRSRHLRTVLASTWNRSAVASIVQPAFADLNQLDSGEHRSRDELERLLLVSAIAGNQTDEGRCHGLLSEPRQRAVTRKSRSGLRMFCRLLAARAKAKESRDLGKPGNRGQPADA